MGATQRNEKAIQPAHGTKKCPLVGSARARIARTQSRHIRNRPVRFKKVVDGLSELLEVQDKMNVMVRELSLGERMKMELISALIHEPRVLFLDEPTIGLDVVSQKRVREFLRVYNEKRRIVTLLTSHYMQDIQELCHRVLVIDHGKIFFDGPLDEIVDRFSGYKILSLTFEKAAVRDLSRLR